MTQSQQHANTENDDWNLQLPNPDLVAQLDPPITPERHQLPVPDNTLLTLFDWAMALEDISQGARMVLLAIIRHVGWKHGTECRASIPTLAREAHLSERSTKGHIKSLADAGLISRNRRMNQAWVTELVTQAPSMVGEETSPMVGEAASPTGGRSGFTPNQGSSSKPIPMVTPDPVINVKQEGLDRDDGGTESFSFSEEEGTETETTETNSPPRKTLQECEEWVEATKPGSATFWFVDGVLQRYKKQWWRPYTGSNPMSGFAKTTTRSKAGEVYMADTVSWKRLGDDLIAKAFQDGGPFPDFDPRTGANPKLKEKVRCDFKAHVGDRMTMAYGETTTVYKRIEGPEEIDKCDVCLSGQPASMGV